MVRKKVVSIDEIRDSDEAATGAKAASLARIGRLGLATPPGFCIRGAAYRAHLDNLMAALRPALESLDGSEAERRDELLAEIRRRVIDAPMPEPLRAEIKGHFRRLGAERLAVRSSSTAEDLPGHSFAGQYDTFLDVAGLSDCLEAVKKCWASMWTGRAFEYRARNGFEHLATDMAVIVQELVRADASGVVFTADPVTGKSDRLIIEACFGMGEALVSGRVTPVRFVLDKADLSVISLSIPENQDALSAGGTREQTDGSGRSGTACIDETAARRLGELAKKAEAAFGSPQDMEWAIQGGKIFFLQSRPITTLPSRESGEDRQIWTNLNAGEVMPDVVTPMTWSLVPRAVEAIFGSIIRGLGFEFGPNPVIGQIAGRAYFNLNTIAGIIRLFPGLSEKDVTRVFGGEQERAAELGRVEIPEEDVPDLHFSPVRLALGMPRFLFLVLTHLLGRDEKFTADVGRRADELQGVDFRSMPEDELSEFFQSIVDDLMSLVGTVGFSGIGVLFFTALDNICRKWLGDSDGTCASRLLAGMGGMHSAEAGLDLWRLAAEAHRREAVESIVLCGENWERTRKRIEDTPGGGDFLSKWDEFMAEHGHHTRGEIELFNARWSESPDYILGMVRGYLGCFEEVSPCENHEKRAREREELEMQCLRKLRNPAKRLIFKFCLRQTRRGSLIRENLKSIAVRYLTVMRAALVVLGERLVARGVLDSRDDIFFLSMDEVEPVRRGEAAFDVKEVIAARRSEYARNMTITPPKVVVGRFDPDGFIPDEVEEGAEVLTGVAVSPGVVVGPARVILRASAEEHVLPGEILVAPFTDPGWTPYFMPAAAIVMDMGGILSHGSIVAREYGIPAVVNVGPATKIIKTGQTIQVDGNKGVVRIIR